MIRRSPEGSSATAEDRPAEAFRRRLGWAIRVSGFRQKEIAEALGLRPATVSEWLNATGTRNLPSGQSLLRLAGILPVSMHWLLTGRGPTHPQEGEADAGAFRRLVRLVDEARCDSAPAHAPSRPLPPEAGGDEVAVLGTEPHPVAFVEELIELLKHEGHPNPVQEAFDTAGRDLSLMASRGHLSRSDWSHWLTMRSLAITLRVYESDSAPGDPFASDRDSKRA